MHHQTAIMAMLAITSIAALVGVFTVQVADAQLPSLSVSERGVGVLTEELDLSVGARGAIVQTEIFGVTADRSGVEIGSADAQLPSLSVNERGVGVLTEVFSLRADPRSGVSIIPAPQ
jgi:hypothetical protein